MRDLQLAGSKVKLFNELYQAIYRLYFCDPEKLRLLQLGFDEQQSLQAFRVANKVNYDFFQGSCQQLLYFLHPLQVKVIEL